MISFKIDWFDLLTVQGNLKSLLLEQIHERMGGGEVSVKAIKHRFICLIHSEAKQIETFKFGAEMSPLQGQEADQVAHAQRNLSSLMVSGKKFL